MDFTAHETRHHIDYEQGADADRESYNRPAGTVDLEKYEVSPKEIRARSAGKEAAYAFFPDARLGTTSDAPMAWEGAVPRMAAYLTTSHYALVEEAVRQIGITLQVADECRALEKAYSLLERTPGAGYKERQAQKDACLAQIEKWRQALSQERAECRQRLNKPGVASVLTVNAQQVVTRTTSARR